MKEMFKTVMAILIAQVIIYVVSKFSGKTLNTIVAIEAANNADTKTASLEVPKRVQKVFNKLTVMAAKRKAGYGY